MQALGGEQHARYATKSHGAIAAKHRASEGETLVGSITLGGPPAHLAATCALPTSTTATGSNPSSTQDEPQSIRLATCLDRSAAASGAIASTVSPCFRWRKLLSLAERLAVAERLGLVERPSRRAAHRAEASRRGLSPLGDRWAGLGERSKAVSEALRTVARLGRGAGGRATRPSWKTIGSGPASGPPRGQAASALDWPQDQSVQQ